MLTRQLLNAVVDKCSQGYRCSEAISEIYHDWNNDNINEWVESYEPIVNYVMDISEAQKRGVDERLARRTRIDKVTPADKNFDNTPKHDADNDPTQTARGRQALKKRIKSNKKNANKFKKYVEDICAKLGIDNAIAEEYISNTMPTRIFNYDKLYKLSGDYRAAMLALESDDLNLLVNNLANPIDEYSIFESIDDDKARIVCDVIKNVWLNKQYSRSVGIASNNKLDTELVVFDEAIKLKNRLKDFGYGHVWVERIRKPGYIGYKVYGDKTPSNTYMEHKSLNDRDLILSNDRSNIIQIFYGDQNAV